MDLSGKYRCEVSTDAPKFYTKVDSGHLQVARKFNVIKNYFSVLIYIYIYSTGGNCPHALRKCY